MTKTLKDLYYGNLTLFDHDISSGSPIHKSSAHLSQCETKLREKLGPEERTLLEDLLNTQQDMDGVTAEENAELDFSRAGEYTVGQWMDVWFENCAKVKVRPSSHQTYRGYIDHHIKPYIGDIQLNKLTTLDLQRLYKKLLSGGRVERIEAEKQPKGLSPKTVRNINQVISSALTFAKEQKLIISNPTEGCSLPKLEHREMKTLTTEQLASFLREAKESGVYEMYYIELATGLRRGELLGLKWYAGSLFRRLHPGYLRPRDHPSATPGGQHDGEYPFRCRLALSKPFPVWVSVWVKAKAQK